MTRTIRIYGPPGTGKTTHLLNRVQDELEQGIEPSEIIYTSFTRAAANEARDRALSKFPDYGPEQFCWFSTIHSICFRILGLHRDRVFAGRQLKSFCKSFGYDTSATDKNPEMDDEIQGQILQTTADYFEFFINWYRNMMMEFDDAYHMFIRTIDIPHSVTFTYEQLRSYITRRNEYKQTHSLWDFCDMIESVLMRQMVPSGAIKVMFSDEYQDLTPLLSQIVEMWAREVDRYYIAGDPYQAIYQWMGADPSIFLNTRSDEDITLHQSYRCSKAVHDLSRRIVGRFRTRYNDDDFMPTKQIGKIEHMWPAQIDWQAFTDDSVFYLHRTNYLMSLAIAELTANGVPFGTMRGTEAPLQTSRAKVVDSLMQLLDGKYVSAQEMLRIMEHIHTRTSREQFLRQGAKADMKRLAGDKPNINYSMRDLSMLGFTPTYMHYFNFHSVLEPLNITMAEKDYFRTVITKFGVEVLGQPPKIILSTIHGVKGKEADTVIINLNLTKRTYEAMIDQPEPEHRLFYVGVTRSRNRVILLQPEDTQAYYI